MSNFATLIDVAKAKTEDELGGWLQTLGITPNLALHDEPDQYGAVAVRGINPKRPESHQRFIIQEIVDSLPAGFAKSYGQHCINNVNGWYEFNETKTFACQDGNGNNIPNLLAVASIDKRTGNPVWPTVQAFADGINALAEPSVPNGSFGPTQ